MRKTLAVLLTLSLFAFAGYGCDGGSSGGIIEESHGIVGLDTSATRLYYPSEISGTTGATTMSSGYTGNLGDVEWLSTRIAEAGFVVLAFTPLNTYGYVDQWRDAHKAVINELISINNTHSALRGKIDTTKLNTCGHSKGGGGSLWASSDLGSKLKTTVGMAPYEEGFFDSALRTITAATFIQAGASDTLATNSMTRGEYGGLSDDISKMYVEYTGYDHLAWANADGTIADRLSGDIIAWFKYYMNGDTSASSTLANESGTSRYEWVDNTNSSSSSSGGCN